MPGRRRSQGCRQGSAPTSAWHTARPRLELSPAPGPAFGNAHGFRPLGGQRSGQTLVCAEAPRSVPGCDKIPWLCPGDPGALGPPPRAPVQTSAPHPPPTHARPLLSGPWRGPDEAGATGAPAPTRGCSDLTGAQGLGATDSLHGSLQTRGRVNGGSAGWWRGCRCAWGPGPLLSGRAAAPPRGSHPRGGRWGPAPVPGPESGGAGLAASRPRLLPSGAPVGSLLVPAPQHRPE